MTSTSRSESRFPPQSTSLGEIPQQNSHECGRTPRYNVKTLAEHALTILQTTSSLVAGAAGDLTIPGLGIGLTALAELLKKVQTMKSNIKGVDTLVAHVAELSTRLATFFSQPRNQPLPEVMRRRIEETIRVWSGLAEQAQCLKNPGAIKRFFTGDATAKKLEGLIRDINSSMQELLFAGALNVEEIVHCLHEDTTAIRQDVGELCKAVTVVRKGVDTVCEDARTLRQDVELVHGDLVLLHQDVKDIKAQCDDSFTLVYAKNAPYDASDVRRPCLEGTRVAVLKRFCDWVAMSISYKDIILATNPGNVFWICGMAGTGKTTVAFSIAQLCREEGILGASFFCSRFDAECNDPKMVFTTISQQLCNFYPPFKENVSEIMKKDPTIVTASTERQFEELILRPLEELECTFPLSVIVLDALDECRHVGAISTVLGVIAKYACRTSGYLLFVVTSRPERPVAALFESAEENTLRDATTPLLLHTIEPASVLADITRYLEDGFKSIRRIFQLTNWPSAEVINRFAELSGGLFIWASTALLFIGDVNCSDPQGRLDILNNLPSSQASSSILDALYGEIANMAFANISGSYGQRLHSLLGTLAIAQEPVTVATLAGLVQMGENSVRLALTRMHSVLYLPEDRSKPIRIIHPTFAEFLLNSSAKKPDVLNINPDIQHASLFLRCMELIGGLERNVCGIIKPSLFYDEVPRLADVVKTCIPAHVVYACRHWSKHMGGCASSVLPTIIYDSLHGFLTSGLLHWLEACSLLRILGDAGAALAEAGRVCEKIGGPFLNLIPLLRDCHEFLFVYAPIIHTAPLQLYHSALALAPTENLVKKTYTTELNHSLLVPCGAPSHWASCLDVLRVREGWVLVLTFSPCGGYFATGCSDGKITVWTTATRTVYRCFYGHTGWVTSVAFSPDGAHVASGSDDRTVRIWDTLSGNCLHTLEHARQVESVAYSEDGCRFLSSISGGESKLWDTTTWGCTVTLAKPFMAAQVTSQVSSSPNGDIIAYGAGTSLHLYHLSSDMHSTLDLPGEVKSAQFSWDGCYVAARTDHTIQVWKCTDESLVDSIDSKQELSGPLALSPDCTRIGCGSLDGSVHLWRLQSEYLPHVYRGRGEKTRDLSWSPDGSKIISLSGRYTVQVWDAMKNPTLAIADGSSAPVPTPSMAPEFALIKNDREIIAILHLPSLGIDVDQFTTTPMTPRDAPTLLLFADIVDACDAALKHSANLQLSDECYSPEWALVTGNRSVAFSWRPVAISPDGLLFAYRSSASDNVVDICHLHSGTKVLTLVGHTGCVRSLAFSPDSSHLVTGSDDESIKVWDATTGGLICGHSKHSNWVLTSIFSSDGSLIVSGSGNGVMIIFEITTSRILQLLSHPDSVLQATFTPDNTRVVSLDDSHRVYVWDVATGAHVCEVPLADIQTLRSTPNVTTILGTHEPLGAPHTALWTHESHLWRIYEVSRDGWLTAKGIGHMARMCWLPPEWRDFIPLDTTKICCLDCERRQAVVVDISRLPEYSQARGSGTE